MSELSTDTLADARERALAAADREGLRIEELGTAELHHEAAELLRRVWRADSADEVMNAAMMTALAHAGNYVVGAYAGDELVGVTVGFFGVGQLHSHLAGVDPATQARGIGFAMKQHQRAWALARGIPRVCWTFDPLVRRNAHFNLTKLGGRAIEYLPDFYGPLTDGINAGDRSNRLYLCWELASPAAVEAAHGRRAETDAAKARADGAAVLLDRTSGRTTRDGTTTDRTSESTTSDRTTRDGTTTDRTTTDRTGERPVRGADRLTAGHTRALIAVPTDIEGMRTRDPELAAAWRLAVRDAMVPAFAAGLVVVGMSGDGFYHLHRAEGS